MSQNTTLLHETTTSTYFSPTIPPHAYVTRIEVDSAQEMQDRGIRREFKTVHEKLDALRNESTHRFDKLTSDIDYLKSSHEKLQTDVQDLKALFFNQGAYKAWDTVAPSSMNGEYPTNFPDKVIKFWHLQRSGNHAHLMSLIRFYKLDAALHYYYSEASHSFMSEKDAKSQETQTEQDHPSNSGECLSDSALQTLIKQQPLSVLRVLADWLRLDFAAIQSRMPEVSASPPATIQKRFVESEDGSPEGQKKAKPSTPPKQKSSQRPQFDFNSSFGRALIRDPEEVIQRSPESSEGHITWDRGSRNLLHRLPKKTVPPRSSPLPDDSSEGKLTSTLRLSELSNADEGSEKGDKPP